MRLILITEISLFMSTFDRLLPTLMGIILSTLNLIGQSDELLQRTAVRYQSAYQVPGLAIALIRPDTFYIGLSGNKQVGKDMPIKKNDLFHLGSNTKAFTAFLAAYWVEQGAIKWSNKLMEVVPELDLPAYEAYRHITLEQLLSHRAGIAAFESASSKEFRAIPKDIQTHEDPRLTFAQVALSFPPSTAEQKNHLYSNGGYILAALMLERATGLSYEKLLQKLGEKLNLKLSFGFPNTPPNANILGHRRRFFGRLNRRPYRSLDVNNSFRMQPFFAPAGDVSTSIHDLALWVQYHLRGLLGAGTLIEAEAYHKLHYGLADYGLGWYNGIIGDGPDQFSYHGGSLGTFSSAVMLSADRKIGIVILVNAESKQVQRLKEELRVELWKSFGGSAND